MHAQSCLLLPDVRILEREERRLPRQCNSQKKGSLLLTGARAFCRNHRSGAGSESPEQRRLPKFIRYAQVVSSWLKQIGYMFAKQFYWYKLSQAFVQT